MARDTREIHSGIRLERQVVNGPNVSTVATVYGKNDMDELAAALTPEQGEYFLQQQAISGNWKFTGTSPEREPVKNLVALGTAAPGLSAELEVARAKNAALEKELESVKTELQEALSGNTRLQDGLANANRIIETGKAENKRQHDELTELGPLKRENTALKAKAPAVASTA